MKLATFTTDGRTRIGRIDGACVVDLSKAAPSLPATMLELLQGGEPLLAMARSAVATSESTFDLSSVKLEAPLRNPQKFMGIGLNYHDHAEEARRDGIKIPESQVWFSKQASCIAGPFEGVQLPRSTGKLDYEVELGVVIGKRCKHVPVEDARSVIAGYFVTNDFTARDWQHRTPQWTLGKSFDTHGPCGPWIVTSDEIADPHALSIRLTVNGEVRQNGTTSQMIYNVYEQIAHLSSVMTLEPGDLIATGTCAGVGVAMKPPRFLQIGDVVRAEVEGLGYIENTIVAEPL